MNEFGMQPAPRVGPRDVERVVCREFPGEVEAAMAMLLEYGAETWQPEPDRVRLAVLKLADRDLGQLRYHVDMAKRDYRDVLAFAEYPEYMARVPPSGKAPDSRERAVIERDWTQYHAWLRRK